MRDFILQHFCLSTCNSISIFHFILQLANILQPNDGKCHLKKRTVNNVEELYYDKTLDMVRILFSENQNFTLLSISST